MNLLGRRWLLVVVVACLVVLTACTQRADGLQRAGLRVAGENLGFGMALPAIADGGSASIGSVMLCTDTEGASVDITGVEFATTDGITVEDYRVRPNPGENTDPAERYTLGGNAGTLDHLGFEGGRRVSAVCGTSSVELGVQLARSTKPVATAKNLEVRYENTEGAQGTLTVLLDMTLCGHGVPEKDCQIG